jgi:hypothetical protein
MRAAHRVCWLDRLICRWFGHRYIFQLPHAQTAWCCRCEHVWTLGER